MRYHWTGGKNAYVPKSEACILGLRIMAKTKGIILQLKPKIWAVENPRGVMRKKIGWENYRKTITYCQYGAGYMKPTDIWTNSKYWVPRPECKNGDPCHEAAPRGAKTGSQGLADAKSRGVIPPALCESFVIAWEDEILEGVE
jgi:hypothetical protein